MRATEFLDFLNSDVIDDELYSHIEIRGSEGKLKKDYKKLRKKYRKNIKIGERNDNTRKIQG
jgi:hypothetical protein|tara:strand:- start:1411 stop:1596 length:186 start_codon:yes stop_codon:yes gene_type:complete